MSPDEILALARAGDTAAVAGNVEALSQAVEAFVAAGRTGAALEIVGRAWRIWTSSGELAAGAAAAKRAIDAPRGEPDIWLARALYGDGVIAFRQGDDRRSRARNEELLRFARSTGDARGECDALTGLARLALRAGDYSEVVTLARGARHLARAAADVVAEAAPLHLEAAGVRLQGDYAQARDLYVESMDLNASLGNGPVMAMEQHNLGWVELHLGDIDTAEAWFRRRDAASQPDAYGDAWASLNWSAIAAARGRWEEAHRLFLHGSGALAALGVVLDPDDALERAWLEALLAEHAC